MGTPRRLIREIFVDDRDDEIVLIHVVDESVEERGRGKRIVVSVLEEVIDYFRPPPKKGR